MGQREKNRKFVLLEAKGIEHGRKRIKSIPVLNLEKIGVISSRRYSSQNFLLSQFHKTDCHGKTTSNNITRGNKSPRPHTD